MVMASENGDIESPVGVIDTISVQVLYVCNLRACVCAHKRTDDTHILAGRKRHGIAESR